MIPKAMPSPDYNKNVSPNWKPVESLKERKTGMAFSDRLWYWLVSLGGLAVIGVGVAVLFYAHMQKLSGWLIGVGLVVFVLGTPGQAARNGYRGD